MLCKPETFEHFIGSTRLPSCSLAEHSSKPKELSSDACHSRKASGGQLEAEGSTSRSDLQAYGGALPGWSRASPEQISMRFTGCFAGTYALQHSFATSAAGPSDSEVHDDFKPQVKAAPSASVAEQIEQDVKGHKVFLYMKVSPVCSWAPQGKGRAVPAALQMPSTALAELERGGSHCDLAPQMAVKHCLA